MKQYIVLHGKHSRFSVTKTDENRQTLHKEFVMHLIHKDDNGTEHWQVISPRKKKRV